MFFCKDCDGYRVRGKTVAVVGTSNEAVGYALGMLTYTSKVTLLTNGNKPSWDVRHAEWIERYKIPVLLGKIEQVEHDCGAISSFSFQGGAALKLHVLFTVRGDLIHNDLAKSLGLALDQEGQIVIDLEMRTSLCGVYAAGCVTPANCQMIIAAGQGAAAAQAINRDLFQQSLEDNRLEQVRDEQIKEEPVLPEFSGTLR